MLSQVWPGVLGFVLFGTVGLAQKLTLSGSVNDSQGVAPNVTVTLKEQGSNSLATAIRNISGASSSPGYGMFQYYTIRGFRSGGSADLRGDVVLADGVRVLGNRINTQLDGVERIDVLKGPSSILYGGQSLSGAINIIRKKPQAPRAYDFFYRGGRFNTHQVGRCATGQIFTLIRLFYRVVASYHYTVPWRDAGARLLSVPATLTWS